MERQTPRDTTNHASQRIILASVSPRRRELLALICPDFEVVPPRFDESGMREDLSPEEHVSISAREKARQVAADVRDGLVIGADTVVAVEGRILGKPADEADAARMLRLLSGRTHQVYTGIHVVDAAYRGARAGRRERSAVERTDVTFRKLRERTIERYVATGEPMDKAGAYAIQGRGAVLVEGISGCFFNVVGLPVYRLSVTLEELGMEVFACR